VEETMLLLVGQLGKHGSMVKPKSVSTKTKLTKYLEKKIMNFLNPEQNGSLHKNMSFSGSSTFNSII